MRSLVTPVLASALLVSLSGCERYALDRQMEELCAKDGGIKVYETVTLPANYFYQDGTMKHGQTMTLGTDSNITFERVGDDDFRIVTEKQYLSGSRLTNLQKGDGVLIRIKVSVIRWKDRHVLGEQIRFDRGGGDFFTFGFQPSGNACPLPRVDLASSIFVKGE